MSSTTDNIYTNGSNYYVITRKAQYNNICVELKTFNNKFISNDDLNNMTAIPFNKENMRKIIVTIDVYNQINYNDDDFDINNYIIYKNKFIQINNWENLLNFIADKI